MAVVEQHAAAPRPNVAPGRSSVIEERKGRLKWMLSLEDFEEPARKYLPKSIFGYVSGGVETNWSLRSNRETFGKWAFTPRTLVDVSKRQSSRAVFGQTYDAPFGIAPMGASGICGYHADLAFARATAKANIPQLLSGASITTMEKIIAANPNAWFQAYLPPDRERMDALVDRVARAGYQNLVVTTDVPIGGNRENNIRNGYSSPLRPSLRLAWDGITHPRWLIETAARTLWNDGMPHFENGGPTRGVPVLSANADRSLTRDSMHWGDMERLRARWKGRMLLKGILSVEDARKAREIGMDGIFVSNHGGRQLDGAASPLRVLPDIAKEARTMTVVYDGGARRGSDVIKALALGADFVFIGRPFLYAASIAGEAGVDHAIALLKDEILRDMALLGIADLNDLSSLVIPA